MRFLVVTGLSGAGKTSVNRYLEDMGAFCVDNLPPNMMFRMMEAIEKSALHRPLFTMAMDVRKIGQRSDCREPAARLSNRYALP